MSTRYVSESLSSPADLVLGQEVHVFLWSQVEYFASYGEDTSKPSFHAIIEWLSHIPYLPAFVYSISNDGVVLYSPVFKKYVPFLNVEGINKVFYEED